jgi:hypothetical protein
MNEATKEENERDIAMLRAENQVVLIKYKHARVGLESLWGSSTYNVVALNNDKQITVALFPFTEDMESQTTARIMAQQLADKINWC